MGRIRASRPAPAVLVAVLALVATIAGTAVAGPEANTSALNKKKVKKLVKKEVAKQIGKATGPQGPPGATGAQGPPGVSGLVRVRTPSTLQASESVKFAMATCPAGKRVIGSGADIRAGVTGDPPNQLAEVVINEIIPSEETVVPGNVIVRAYEIGAGTTEEWGVSALALCANVS